MEGEIPTRIMILDMYPNTRETNHFFSVSDLSIMDHQLHQDKQIVQSKPPQFIHINLGVLQ